MESNTVKIKSRCTPGSYSIINADDYDPQTHEIFSGEDLPGEVVRREMDYIWDRIKRLSSIAEEPVPNDQAH